jgi:hypothetical protein
VDLKLGHHATDGIEVIDVQGEIDMYTALEEQRNGEWRYLESLQVTS